jgi:hypothetical protein
MKHFKKVSVQLPAKAVEKGDFKSCGPIKDFFGLCDEENGPF